jgi:hypothetical protein
MHLFWSKILFFWRLECCILLEIHMFMKVLKLNMIQQMPNVRVIKTFHIYIYVNIKHNFDNVIVYKKSIPCPYCQGNYTNRCLYLLMSKTAQWTNCEHYIFIFTVTVVYRSFNTLVSYLSNLKNLKTLPYCIVHYYVNKISKYCQSFANFTCLFNPHGVYILLFVEINVTIWSERFTLLMNILFHFAEFKFNLPLILHCKTLFLLSV